MLSINSPVPIGWSLKYKPSWLSVHPTAGGNGNVEIFVNASISTLLPQELNDKIVISTTTGLLEVPVALTVTETSAVQLHTSSSLIDYDETERLVTIVNNSNQPTTWELEPLAGLVEIKPASGTLAAGQSATLSLTVNRENLQTKTYNENLELKLGGIKTSEFQFTINHFKEEKILLERAVMDAAYDRNGDNLLILSGDALYKLDPETGVLSSVELSQHGSCFSVGIDGQYAIVGHYKAISLVNLTSMQIEKSYQISVDAWSVVLAPNNWAYVFPEGQGWTNITCVNLENGVEVLSTGGNIYAGTKGKIHPSGDYIYGRTQGLSPTDVEKYDVRNGQALYLHDSPYHGEYDFSGNLWLSQDGDRMFTYVSDVFNLSEAQSEDMVYHQTMYSKENVFIAGFDHFASRNLLALILDDYNSQQRKNQLTLSSADELNQIDTIYLPDFLVGEQGYQQIVQAAGAYAFFNSTGTKVYAIVHSTNAPFVSEIDWAVATINLE